MAIFFFYLTYTKQQTCFHVTFFSLFAFDPCRQNEKKLSHIIFVIVSFETNAYARSRKTTLKIATPNLTI